jgi:hypothetical protein
VTPGAEDGDQTRTSESPESEEQEKSGGWNGYGPPPVREYTPPVAAEPTEPAEPVASSDSPEPSRAPAWNGYGPPPTRDDEPSATPDPSTDSAEPAESSEPAEPDPVAVSTEAVEPTESDEPVAAADSTEPAEATESTESADATESAEDEAADEWDGSGPPPIRRREPVMPVYPKTTAAPKGPVPGPPRPRQGGRWSSDEEAGPPPSNRMAIAAIILGAASIPFGLTGYLGVIAGLFAIIFGIIGLRQAKRGRSTRPRLALAGSILGIVGLVLSIVVLVVSVHKINDCKKHIGHTPNRQELTQCAREHI